MSKRAWGGKCSHIEQAARCKEICSSCTPACPSLGDRACPAPKPALIACAATTNPDQSLFSHPTTPWHPTTPHSRGRSPCTVLPRRDGPAALANLAAFPVKLVCATAVASIVLALVGAALTEALQGLCSRHLFGEQGRQFCAFRQRLLRTKKLC